MNITSLFQHVVNKIYRQPRAKYRTIMRFGGLGSYVKMISGKRKMIERSNELPSIPSYDNGLEIYFLTGNAYIHQTLFCAYSLTKASKEQYRFYLVDDGTFTKEIEDNLRSKMPNVTIISAQQILTNLNHVIPFEGFPYLRNKRKVYPHIKKLTDIHTSLTNKFKLVLDSDMLFFDEPVALIAWLKNPKGCIHMTDCEESYGYSNTLMNKLCNAEIPKLMNVGAIGFNDNNINWSEIDTWIDELEKNEGGSYFLEQALSAMIASNLNRLVLDNEKYIVNPKKYRKGDVLHHYVDLSKKYYFEEAWKIIYE